MENNTKIRLEDYEISISDIHPLPDLVVKYKLYRAERDVEELKRKLFETQLESIKHRKNEKFRSMLNSVAICLLAIAFIVTSLKK